MLVLSEGARTEPIYFSGLKRSRDLAQLRPRGLAPGEGLHGLARRVERELARSNEFDELWCVVDHDGRDQQIEDFRGKINGFRKHYSQPIRVVISRPCFEYWLLLHFEDSRKAYSDLPGRSACAEVTRELRRFLKGYEKNDPQLFDKCSDGMFDAIERARRPNDEGSSHTEVGELVERVLRLAGDGSA